MGNEVTPLECFFTTEGTSQPDGNHGSAYGGEGKMKQMIPLASIVQRLKQSVAKP
jgi:hypothetical protein